MVLFMANTTQTLKVEVMEAQKKYEWIVARLNEGRTVYLATALRVTKLSRKHHGQIRVRNNVLEIQTGGRWLDYNHTRISAR